MRPKVAIIGSLSCLPKIKRLKREFEELADVTAPPYYTNYFDKEALERGEKKLVCKPSPGLCLKLHQVAEQRWMKAIEPVDMVYVVLKDAKGTNIGMETFFELLYALAIGKRVYAEGRIRCDLLEDWVRDVVETTDPEGFKDVLRKYRG